jgi:diguanylate cyclase (GGDEF)-like protein
MLCDAAVLGPVAGWFATACRLRIRTRERAVLVAALYGEQREVHRLRSDPVTGLLTRAAWEPQAQVLLAGDHNVLGFVDLDEFKPVNDLLGHDAGDDVLCAVATRMREQLGESALVGRVGGDELAFVAALSGFPVPAADLDRLVAAITAPIEVASGRQVSIGVSIGLAWRCDLPSAREAVQLSEAMAAADAAMYDAKRSGAGWCLFDPDVHPARPVDALVPRPRHRLREFGPEVANSEDPVACER